jgi:hypothetical protein
VQPSLVIQDCIIQIAVQQLKSFFEIFVVCTSTPTDFLFGCICGRNGPDFFSPAALHPFKPLDISNWAITGLCSELLPCNMSFAKPIW